MENKEIAIQLSGVKKMYKLGQIGGAGDQLIHNFQFVQTGKGHYGIFVHILRKFVFHSYILRNYFFVFR